MEKQLKEIIRSVIREEFISELSKNDIHVKEIMKFYDKGTYSTKKAVSIFVSGKTNASRNQILDDLGDMGYNDAWEVMDHFKLKIESVNEASTSFVSGNSGRIITNLDNKKYQLTKDVKGAQIGNYTNVVLPKGSIIHNLSGGVFVSHPSLKDKFSDIKEIPKFGFRVKTHPNTLITIEKSSKILESVNEADVVPGGLAKGLSLNDIAEKHGVSVDIMVAEFKKGIAVEMEHTTDREVAKEITLDHLFEDPKYYDKLKKVEEYVDKKGVEHVAAALPQTEEEPVNEGKDCGCGCN